MRQVVIILLTVIGLYGCKTTQSPSYDYSAFLAAAPTSIVVMPPINNTPEVMAPYGLMAQIVRPIAEAGYYVFPVAVVNQTFMANGMTVAQDVHAIPYQKLHEIFGADAGLYITIRDYGTSYIVVNSVTVVSAEATLVDLRSGEILWQGAASASSGENRGANQNGLLGMLVEAALTQIIETVTDRGFDVAGIAASRLLSTKAHNGLLPGPRAPNKASPAN
ncbi:DUF799 domain-containing protein [Alteromonas lipolytica]|uniref:Lipoprotein n=1 Tax=Alteromonas lipolytica TaxID=1856405 RepID=A0A1E8F901_9ALTE|nr:DUF799 domain-containing protein [Alteromonas lipolytica]OFI32401.1 hypothetical protein BFC17_06710 [Alteromonas lipolytica]GGF79973.1 lipoprotein [Alteromonas lipolytica]